MTRRSPARARRARSPAAGTPQAREVVGQIERDAAVAIAERLDAAPDHLAGGGERVEIGRRVAVDRAPTGSRSRGSTPGSGAPCRFSITSSSASSPVAAPDEPLPRRHQPRQHRRLDRLDLLAQLARASAGGSSAAPPDRTTRVRRRPAGTPLRAAARSAASVVEQRLGRRAAQRVARGELGGGERAVRARVAPREIRAPRRATGSSSDSGRPAAAARRARRGSVPRTRPGRTVRGVPADARRRRCAPDRARARRARPTARRTRLPGGDLVGRQVAETQQQIVHAVGRSRAVALVELLQLALDVGERVRVEQLAQLGLAEQLPQLRLIDRQRLRAPFRQRRVAVVDVVGDVAEEQRRGERRRRGRVHGDRADARALRSAAACRPAPACRTRRAGTSR